MWSFVKNRKLTMIDLVRLMVAALIIKVTGSVVSNYVDYLPPDFGSNFLLGRRDYFFGSYSIAFYGHIVTGPVSLLLAVVLMSQRFRLRFRRWHARLGRIQIVIVLLVSVSGLWMSRHTETGAIAGLGFASLAVATGIFALLGLLSAKRKQFDSHQRWMWRCFLCLCSAVVLRLTAGLAATTGTGGDWLYPASAWASWLVPLFVFELNRLYRERTSNRNTTLRSR
ncbi:MAG: DUF2306 domain-containing protein [Planctomycetaceae bacterium]